MQRQRLHHVPVAGRASTALMLYWEAVTTTQRPAPRISK